MKRKKSTLPKQMIKQPRTMAPPPRWQTDKIYLSAVATVNTLVNFYQPHTVIDVGCGEGTWLEVWQKAGAVVAGIDSPIDAANLKINPKCVIEADLENEHINCEDKFALAMSLEVGNRLSAGRADSFVHELTALSDVVMFSSAVPGQDGASQVNARWQSYWAGKFSAEGYVAIDCLRPFLWESKGVIVYYAQNILLYVREAALVSFPNLLDFSLKHRNVIYDLVHPAAWEEKKNIG